MLAKAPIDSTSSYDSTDLTGALASTARASESVLHTRRFFNAPATWSVFVRAIHRRWRGNVASAIEVVDPECAHGDRDAWTVGRFCVNRAFVESESNEGCADRED